MKLRGFLSMVLLSGAATAVAGQGPEVIKGAAARAGPGPAEGGELSLSDCIGIALQKSTAVLKGNNDIALAGTQVLAAYGQYLPNVQAAGGVNYDKGNNWFGSTGIALAGEARGAYN